MRTDEILALLPHTRREDGAVEVNRELLGAKGSFLLNSQPMQDAFELWEDPSRPAIAILKTKSPSD